MNILLIGGTRFVGRAIVTQALNDGHTVTLFNRGQSNPDAFQNKVTTLQGDRNTQLELLRSGAWDVVIDTCAYVPRQVRQATDVLRERVGRYVLISSISVFANFDTVGLTEQSPLATLQDDSTEAVTVETYGGLKVLCEQAAVDAFGDKALIIRPGLVVGPHDPTDRFSYWPYRVRQGGKVLVPGDADTPLQFIDVRDLAKFTLKAITDERSGAYIATGPAYALTMQAFLNTCKAVTKSDASFVFAGDNFLETRMADNSLTPWWLPKAYKGFGSININKALQAGLELRPLAATTEDTLEWLASRELDYVWQSGFLPEVEEALLQELR